MGISKVCILGGTGFVGRHLANRLCSSGITCIIPSRNPQRHRQLSLAGRAQLIAYDPADSKQLASLFTGCDAVINLVGILNELGANQRFQEAHVALADRVVEACKAAGVNRLLHMSALHANEANGPSTYLKTKGEAENRTHTLGQPQLRVTSFRPSIIFGPDDSFFNRFAGLLQSIPGPFPLACPEARFAPVYVGDVAEAFARTLDDRQSWGQHYELCGPRVLTLKQLVEYTAKCLGKPKLIIGLSQRLSALQARMLGMLPGKPMSYDNYLSLQVPSVCNDDGLARLGIEPTDIDAVVPYFLGQKGERGRLLELRKRC
jgi:NADH dehydrogenase